MSELFDAIAGLIFYGSLALLVTLPIVAAGLWFGGPPVCPKCGLLQAEARSTECRCEWANRDAL
jgi:hypothetical protein